MKVLVTAAVSLIAALSAGAVAALAASSHRRVSTSGNVGALRIDHSTARQIRARLGPPAARQADGTFGAPAPYYARYDAMGYGCHADSPNVHAMPVGSRACTTVYYVNVRTGRLAAFFTSSPAYTGPGGMHARMSAARAERLSHTGAYGGCMTGMSFGGSFHGKHTAAWLFAPVIGGHDGKPTPSGIPYYGGRVTSLEVESTRHPVGLLFC